MSISKAVILAAGRGTRFLPFTKTVPKEMLPIVDTPVMHMIVKEAIDSGVTDILIVTNKHKHVLEDYFSVNEDLEDYLAKMGKESEIELIRTFSNVNIKFVEQLEAMGTGEAIMLARGFTCGQAFAVLFGDDYIATEGAPVTKQLCDCYEETGSVVVGVQKVGKKAISMYGAMDVESISDRTIKVRGLVEKPAPGTEPSLYACLGRIVLTRDIYDYLLRTPRSAKGELCLTDAINVMAKEQGCYAYDFVGSRYDMGNKLGSVIANVERALVHPETRDGMREYLKALSETIKSEQ